jgi:hypothetical protein
MPGKISFKSEARAKSISFDKENIWIEFTDGRQLGVPLRYFPRLFKANSVERSQYTLSAAGIGLHWEQLDEDISVPELLAGNFARKKKRVA